MKIIDTFDVSEYPWVTYDVPSNNGPTGAAWERIVHGAITDDGQILLLTATGWLDLHEVRGRMMTWEDYNTAHPKPLF